MARHIYINNHFLQKDIQYNSHLISLLINKVVRHGKKRLAECIVNQALRLLYTKVKSSPIFVLETAVLNVRPQIKVQSIGKRKNRSLKVIPFRLLPSLKIGMEWIVESAKKRASKGIKKSLASEIFEAYKGYGLSIKKKEAFHRSIHEKKTAIEDTVTNTKLVTDTEFVTDTELDDFS